MRKVQFGTSLTGDLKEGTWTFEVEDMNLMAGEFAIVRKEEYSRVLEALDSAYIAIRHDSSPSEEHLDAYKKIEKAIYL